MTDDPPAPTFPHRVPKGPRKPRDPDAPAHYRLSPETWALILAEYREGATAPELVLKWRVSLHALRKQITRTESTKREHGDEQAIARAGERAAAIKAARNDSPEARAARLFDGIGALDDDEAGDPAVLARVATRASGRAMTGRLWSEARALAGLAESYARLAERERVAAPPEDPTEPGRQAALAYLRQEALRDYDAVDAAAALAD